VSESKKTATTQEPPKKETVHTNSSERSTTAVLDHPGMKPEDLKFRPGFLENLYKKP